MSVFELHLTLSGLPDVGDDVLGLDRIGANEVSDRRMSGSLRVEELPNPSALEKTYPPAICMFIRQTPTGLKSCEGKTNICWNIAVHPEKLTHLSILTDFFHRGDRTDSFNSHLRYSGLTP